MPAFIHVDQNTFKVEVRHDLGTPVFPSAQLIEIEKASAEIQAQLKDFIDNKHNPALKNLLVQVEAWNLANNPEYAAKKAAASPPPPAPVAAQPEAGIVGKKKRVSSLVKAYPKDRKRK